MRHVVVGGGVAGVCCAEELCRLLPEDEVVLVSADRVLKGVSTVARITKNIEELKVEEKQLDSLPYSNLSMVQDVAAGIDLENKALLLRSHPPLPFDKLCICAGARPKQLAALDSPYIITLRDTQSLEDLCAKLAGSRRVMVVGNGAIALEAVFALRGMEVVWALKHGHIGDAIFDLDAAEFLLEEMQHQQVQQEEAKEEQQEQGQQPGSGGQQAEGQAARQQQGQPQGKHAVGIYRHRQRQAGQPQQLSEGQSPSPSSSHPGTLGHAVGPTWVDALPHVGGQTRVVLEYGCNVESVAPGGSGSSEGAAGLAEPGATVASNGSQQQQQEPGQQPGAATATEARPGQQEDDTSTAQPSQRESLAEPASTTAAPEAAGASCTADGPSLLQEEGKRPWNLVVKLTNGKTYGVDLIISAIGVTPALDWVPEEVQRGKDGGLLVDRCMQTSQPGIYAAGDSCTATWAAEDSPHWFQMRLWTQARMMGVFAAHCMAGVQEQTGVGMAFELFTHATRFMGHKVVLLGLYNGQRLEGEDPGEVVTYSRVTEDPGERTFVRILLLRGRVQGAVLIGETDLEETMENLILDQLDVSSYGPSLLDPDFELDHVFD